MKRLRKWALLLLVGLWTVTAAAQSDYCPTMVEQAMAETNQACQSTRRNQACYGHLAIEAEPHPDASNFRFAQSGDIADLFDVNSLRLSSLDSENNLWGVALLRVQANLPSTMPGQNVTMIVFGDTEIADATGIGPSMSVTTSTSANVNIRSLPESKAVVIGTLTTGDYTRASGRTRDGSWLRVRVPSNRSIGWVYRPLVRSDDDINALSIVNLEQPQYGPMQAFYLRTGIGAPRCAEIPDSGILIQSPEGAGMIHLSINQVNIEMGSTLFFETDDTNSLMVNVVEGAAHVNSLGVTRPVVAGSRVRVPLDTTLAPIDAPTVLEPYDAGRMSALPIQSLERNVSIAPAISEEEARRVTENEVIFNILDVHDMDEAFDYLHNNPGASTSNLVAYVEEDLGYQGSDQRGDNGSANGSSDGTNGSGNSTSDGSGNGDGSSDGGSDGSAGGSIGGNQNGGDDGDDAHGNHNGNGNGNGNSNGNGNGNGNGKSNGNHNGNGNGSGNGSGNGNGNGNAQLSLSIGAGYMDAYSDFASDHDDYDGGNGSIGDEGDISNEGDEGNG
jgi:hypothetical protein